MKLLIIEPLGVEKEKLLGLAQEKLGGKVEIVYNDTRVTDTKTLVERAKDADILAFSNLPFKKEVLENCPDLKMISVAFTGVDHVAMDYCRERGILVSNCAGYSNTAVPEQMCIRDRISPTKKTSISQVISILLIRSFLLAPRFWLVKLRQA